VCKIVFVFDVDEDQRETSVRQAVNENEGKTEDLARYARQMLLPELSQGGQLRLRRSKVLVVGAGGLGSSVLEYLAAAGIGTIGIIDFDIVEESNIHRQTIHSLSSIGKLKVDSAAQRIKEISGCNTAVITYPYACDIENARDIIADYDLVIDGTDNFPTRYLVADTCTEFGIPEVWGAILGFSAEVSLFWSAPPGTIPITLRDVFPKAPSPGSIPSCAQAGVIGALCGQAGSIMAMEAIKVLAQMGRTLLGRVLTIDALNARYREIGVRVVGGQPRLEFAGNAFAQVSVEQLCAEIAEARFEEASLLLDVREADEFKAGHIPFAISRPLSTLKRIKPSEKNGISVLPATGGRQVYIYCQSGDRARQAGEIVKSLTQTTPLLVKGSFEAWLASGYPVESSGSIK